jgi:chromosome segregation ATPase
MEDAIAKSRRTMNEFEAACEAGQATGQRYLNAKSNLSEARRCATRDEDAPTGKIDAAVDEAKRELERRGIEAWLDRAETKHEEIEPALEESRYDDACEAYATAASALDSAQDIVSDTENEYDDLEQRIDEVESAIRGAGEEFLDETDAECETALTADETTVAIDAWEEAFDRYSAAVEASWNGQAPVSADAIELQLTWVTSSLLDALGSHASMLEQDGDEYGAISPTELVRRVPDRVGEWLDDTLRSSGDDDTEVKVE